MTGNSKKRIILLAVIALLTGFMGSQLAAQAINFGFTDPDLIIAAMPEYRQVQQQLQQEYQTAQAGLQSLTEDYQAKIERYQKQQALLSAERRSEREAELVAFQQEIQSKATASDQELGQRESDLMNPLLERVQNAIDEIAKNKGLICVFKAPALLYVDESRMVNITGDVARKLGLPVDSQ